MAVLNTVTYIWPIDHAPSVAEAVLLHKLVIDIKLSLLDENRSLDVVHNMGIPGLDPKITWCCTTAENDLTEFDAGPVVVFTDTTKCTFKSRIGGGTNDHYRIYIERLVLWG